MAFHFDPKADSSDDNEGGIDLSAWQLGKSSKASEGSKSPTAPMTIPPVRPVRNGSRDEAQDEEMSEDHIPSMSMSSANQRHISSSPPAVAPAFQPINRSTAAAVTPFTSAAIRRSIADSQVDEDQATIVLQRPALSVPSRKIIVARPRFEGNVDDYQDFTNGEHTVRSVLGEIDGPAGQFSFQVMFDDLHVDRITHDKLLGLENGEEALEAFDHRLSIPVKDADHRSRSSKRLRMSSTRPTRQRRQKDGFVSTVHNIEGSDAEQSEDELAGSLPHGRVCNPGSSQYSDQADSVGASELSEDDFPGPTRRSSRRNRIENDQFSRRRSAQQTGEIDYDDENLTSDEDLPFLESDIPGRQRGKSRRTRRALQFDVDNDEDDLRPKSTRQPTRLTRHKGGMQEIEIDDIYRSDSEGPPMPAKLKPIGIREVFKTLPRGDDFRMRHNQHCETCGQGSNFAALIDCQGCSLVYHKSCLGHRTNREHLVTKVGEDDFVLQCRRCVAFPRKKDKTAPDQGKCQECHHHGINCRPFRPRKTPSQEQKERDDNDGVDPSYSFPEGRLNNPENVLFRCVQCFRGYHFEHLPSLTDDLGMVGTNDDFEADQRFREYKTAWKCKDCLDMPAKVSGLVAWKPVDEDNYDLNYEALDEESKVYLVRWEGMSYFRARWMPGPWVWGVSAAAMRKAFAKREDTQHPKMRTEDAIPEDYLRTDIVLDIQYTSFVDIRTQEIDKARIREIEKALIKYKGLGYEDAVWEAPPSPEDGERWTDFVVAYNDWVMGRYVRQPKQSALKTRLEKARKESFENLEKKTQPRNMEGGKLMEYQVLGLNWLYYKWYSQKNAILADEMGLGKTMQIIGFLATLVQDWDCYPFLVVVPNSTCPNWRREIKRWAPSLRVVAYYGSRESRDLAYRYELHPEGSKDLRCHVVVTSYDAAADENCRKFFRGVSWQGLIVDEGQRLKNDKNQLYTALGALKAPFKVLLTGTPLQNNARELFNLLHFLDDSYDAAQLETEFENLDSEKIQKLHDMIRPFFLRRTKAQVLTFLPPMAQIIVPVSMTIVQKKLYRNILAKNPDLMRAIFSSESHIKQGERGSLSNILMQLRKCLCHPFVYNKGIEERNVSVAASHRNLVDACSKLKLLELLLPKLQERGHRVLIFSQFLDMLDIVEDFLDGMQLRYQRLDGSMNSLTKQKRIDEFNALESPLFAFLLSTRAGGVGINLASADTVIILDPDFNPHQDIQALSRAHRIGQNKKVLCFQLVTRASAEERILQIGRKKLALDHVLIQEMDADDANETDLASVLRHGASELFEDSGDKDIIYDSAGVERLLDRSHMEDTTAGHDESAETQFSHARIWANDQASLEDPVMAEAEEAPDPGVWASILKERERIAAEEAAAKAEAFGRGRRARANVDYAGDVPEGENLDITPIKKRGKRLRQDDGSDTDFQAEESEPDEIEEGETLERGESDDLAAKGAKDQTERKNGKPSSLPTPISNRARKKPKTSQGALKISPSMRLSSSVPGNSVKSSRAPAKSSKVEKAVTPKAVKPRVKKAAKSSIQKTAKSASNIGLDNSEAPNSPVKDASTVGLCVEMPIILSDGEDDSPLKPFSSNEQTRMLSPVSN